MLVEKFTPEVLVSAPRRSPAVPNHDGTLALYTQSTHTIAGSTLKEIRVMDIKTGTSVQLFTNENAHDATWLGDGTNNVIFLRDSSEGITWIMSKDASNPLDPPMILDDIQAPVNNLKLKPLKDGSIAFVVVGLASAEGGLFNGKREKKAHTGQVYDNYRVRVVSVLVSFLG
jgi:hypothetical protein